MVITCDLFLYKNIWITLSPTASSGKKYLGDLDYCATVTKKTMAELMLPPVPPGIDLKANRGPRVIGSTITFIVLPTIFVVLRLISRKVARAGYWVRRIILVLRRECVADRSSGTMLWLLLHWYSKLCKLRRHLLTLDFRSSLMVCAYP